jgi:hypothetical protein
MRKVVVRLDDLGGKTYGQIVAAYAKEAAEVVHGCRNEFVRLEQLLRPRRLLDSLGLQPFVNAVQVF